MPAELNQYHEFVAALCKSGDEIKNNLTPDQCHLLHMSIGVSGEAGELLDAVKKHVIYQKPLDVENVKEEIGDLYFYIQGIVNGLGLDIEEIGRQNVAKLKKRYGEKY